MVKVNVKLEILELENDLEHLKHFLCTCMLYLHHAMCSLRATVVFRVYVCPCMCAGMHVIVHVCSSVC